MTQDGINFDILVSFFEVKNEDQEYIIHKIKSLEDVTKSTEISTLGASLYADTDKVPDFLKVNYPGEHGKITYQVYINALDDNSLKEYANEVGADFARLNDPDNPSAIVIDTVKYIDAAEKNTLKRK